MHPGEERNASDAASPGNSKNQIQRTSCSPRFFKLIRNLTRHQTFWPSGAMSQKLLPGDRCLPQERCRLFDTIDNRAVHTVQLLLVEAVTTAKHSDGPEERDDRVPAGIKPNCKSKSRKTPERLTIVATNKLTVRGKRHHHPAWSALTDQNSTRRCNFGNVNGLSRQVQWVTPTPITVNRQFPTVYLETAGQKPQTNPTASTQLPKTVAPVTLSPWLNRPAQTGSSG